MSQFPQPERAPRGAEHASLEGAPALFRYRAHRRSAAEFRGPLISEFRVGTRRYQAVALRDLSATGMSLRMDGELIPGTRLQDLRITFDGSPVWNGTAEVVHTGQSEPSCVGCRFLGGIVDLDTLAFRSDAVNGYVAPAIEQLRLTDELPAEWVAGVGQYVRLFAIARQGLERVQASRDDWRDQRVSRALCAAMYDAVISEMEEVVRRLATASDRFDKNAREIAMAYSTQVAQDEFGCGEFIGRAFQKPLGYAGDYWMMELLQMDELRGESLYERFLHMCSRESAMGRSVRRRGEIARQRMEELIASSDRPLRIVSLGCGPAIEVRQLLRDCPSFPHKVEFLLVDQDERALEACQDRLGRTLAERGDDPPVELHSLHFSLRQLIAPKRGAERALVRDVLSGVDFIYSMGMFDYLGQPLARRSLAALYSLLRRDGRLFIGNLMRVPESSWVMDYCMAWTLNYRTAYEMLDLVNGIQPMPGQVDVVRGAGDCLLLDVVRE